MTDSVSFDIRGATLTDGEVITSQEQGAHTMKFQAGKTYTTGENRDYVWHFKVLKRTAKFITIQDVTHGEGSTSRVGAAIGYDGNEFASPLGRYSMSPTISADLVAS